jgi:phospholipid/cholesterol/gamma-HCH transport system substrate-binding protein
VDNLNGQLEGDHIKTILENADAMVASLKVSSMKVERVLNNDLPVIVQKVDSILADVKKLSANASEADIKALVARADSTVNEVHKLIEAANSTEGTVGMLLHDNSLYNNVNGTVLTADSLMQEIREQPNSLIWGKKKKKNKK